LDNYLYLSLWRLKIAKTTKKTTTRKKKEVKSNEIKFVDYIGHKLKDIISEDDNSVSLIFDNGFSIKVQGEKIFLRKDKIEQG